MIAASYSEVLCVKKACKIYEFCSAMSGYLCERSLFRKADDVTLGILNCGKTFIKFSMLRILNSTYM